MADDNLKHIDASTPEIQELVENIVGKALSEAVNEGAFCPEMRRDYTAGMGVLCRRVIGRYRE